MPDFFTSLVNVYTTSGLSSVQTVCTFYIIYAYMLYTRKTLWHVLIVHAVSGMLGTFIENTFIAKQMSSPHESWAFLLGLNEINWILHESMTVLYSLLKLETIVIASTQKKILRMIMWAIGSRSISPRRSSRRPG